MNKITVIDPDLQFEEVSLEDALRDRGRWADLASSALEPNPFFEPEFLGPFAEHVAGVPVRIARLSDPMTGALMALVPIVKRRLGLGLAGKPASFFAHDYGPLATPLLDRNRAHKAASDLLYQLLSDDRSLICAPHTRLQGPVFRCLERAAIENGFTMSVIGSYERAVQNARGTKEPYLKAALSKSRRRQFAKQMRRLSAKGEVRLESFSDPVQVGKAFEQFLDLEAAGWKGRSGSALKSRTPALNFAREMAARFIEKGRMRADVLTFNDQPIGVVINFRAGRETFPWKVAFDENHSDASPGMQTLLRTTEANCEDCGVDYADSLTGPESPTVDGLWKERCPMGTLVVTVGHLGALQGALLDYDKTGHEFLRRHVKSVIKRFR